MLKTLHIENFAIVDEANVSFHDGLNIITGETGVGKSLIVDALGIALGERAFKEFIREGHASAIVEAIFELSPEKFSRLKALGYTSNAIRVKREIRLQGNSKVWINGQSSSVQELKMLGDLLVDLHGQHEHQYLLNEDHHIHFLDQYAVADELLAATRSSYQELNRLRKEMAEQERSVISQQEQMELYRFQVQELNDLNPQDNELDDLEKERRILENAQNISESASQLHAAADGEHLSALQRLHEIVSHLEDLGKFTESAESFIKEISAARVTLQGVADFASDYEREIHADPKRLHEVELRIKSLNRTCQKYNRSYPELLEYWSEIKGRLEQHNDPNWNREALKAAITTAAADYGLACARLSDLRQKKAGTLSAEIAERMAVLGMPNSQFRVEVEQEASHEGLVEMEGVRYRGDQSGMDQVSFWMQANVGESLRPLARIASGGEVSRIMLAIKSVMSGRDGISTVIFDEIDTGISGRIARVVGQELKYLGNFHQLICITHLPQIASLADNHFRVEKHVVNQRTVTRVNFLGPEERVSEIAALMGDGNQGEASLMAARELLNRKETV